jgi:hypothetical protein
MTVRKLEKTEWHPFLDGLSKILGAKQAQIEVGSLAIGDQFEAQWLPLYGLVYDPKDDLVEVAMEGVDHMIPKPREIYADVVGGGLITLEIVDAEGRREIVRLKDPLELPAPH